MLTETELWWPVPLEKRHAFQMEFVNTNALGVALIGEVGPGKTTAAVVKTMKLALEYPNNLIYVCRDDAEDLRKTVWDTWLTHYPYEVYGPEGRGIYAIEGGEGLPRELRFFNRSAVMWGSSRDEKRWGGLNLGAVYWDQMEQGHLDQFRRMLFRVRRAQVPEEARQFYSTVNKEANYGWIRALFEEGRAGEVDFPEDIARMFKVIVNPKHVNTEALGKNYYRILGAIATGSQKKRLVDGEDDEMYGRVFWMASKKVHGAKVVDFRQLARERRGEFVISYDHGDMVPSSFHMHFVEEGNRWWTGGERYVAEVGVPEHKEGLKQLADRVGFPLRKDRCHFIGDWAIKGRRSGLMKSIKEEWGRDWPWENASKARDYGFRRMRKQLRDRDERGEAMWNIDSRMCPHLWDELTDLEFDPKKPGEWEFKKVSKGEGRMECDDHAVDDCRYALTGYVRGKLPAVARGLRWDDGAGQISMHRACEKRGMGMIWPVPGVSGPT